jgi:hypothetical protein
VAGVIELLESTMETVQRKAMNFAISALRGLALLWFSVGFCLVITFLILWFYAIIGCYLPTGKSVFASLYAVVGWFLVTAYAVFLWFLSARQLPPTKPVLASRGRRKRIIRIAVVICTVALATEWLWADLLDSIFALLFMMIAHLYRVFCLRRKDIHGWILLYLAGSFVFLTNADKVVEYPDRGFPDYFYVAAYCYWAAIHCYMLHLLLRKCYKPWIWVASAFVVIYFPVLEVPGELIRQYVGRQVTGYQEPVYYTRLRPETLHAVKGPQYEFVICFSRSNGLLFQRKRTPTAFIWPKVGQSLRAPSYTLWINEHFPPKRSTEAH